MKHLPLLLLLTPLLAASCVHVEKTTGKPIHGVLVDEKDRGIAGAQVWAKFQLPGGLLSAPRYTAFGPAITGRDGRFTLDLKPVPMVQTMTVWDGKTKPVIVVIDDRHGGGLLYGTQWKGKEPEFERIVWKKPSVAVSRNPETFIGFLPEEDRAKARAALR